MMLDPATLDWAKGGGLLPAVVQDAAGGGVLMQGWMNSDALAQTQQSGKVTFYSRSKQRLWTKGESSGHWLRLRRVFTDCDRDSILVLADPAGPTCHLGCASCFGLEASFAQDCSTAPDARASTNFLATLDALVAEREQQRPANSYTTRLFESGLRRIAQKVGEEGVETALAAVAQDEAALTGEAADLLYHLLVLLRARGLGLAEVTAELRRRHQA